MKRGLVVVLILLILFTGLPLAFGMEVMEPCPSCPAPDAPISFGACFAILVWAVLIIVLRSFLVAAILAVLKPLLLATALERPPRIA